jgi:hypothetical protein
VLRMSESPASRMARVEHLKSFPLRISLAQTPSVTNRTLLTKRFRAQSSRRRQVSKCRRPPKPLLQDFIAGRTLEILAYLVFGLGNGSRRFTYVVTAEVVDIGLGQHAVVLELRLAEWWCVTLEKMSENCSC